MILTFKCSGCNRLLRVRDTLAGFEVTCPGCNQMNRVPSSTPTPPTAPAEPVPAPDAITTAHAPVDPVPSAKVAQPVSFSSPLEDYGKRYGLIWGILLSAAAIFPVLIAEGGPGHWRLYWPNFQLLAQSTVPGSMKFLMLLPLLAGIAMCVISQLLRGYARALTLIGIGLFMWISILGSEVWTAKVLLGAFVPALGAMIDYVICLMFILAAMFVGFRLQNTNPGTLAGRLAAGISGGILLLMLVLPVLPVEAGSLFLTLPFDAMGQHLGLGLILLLQLLAFIALGIMGCTTFQKSISANRLVSATASWILLLTIFILPLLYYEVLFDGFRRGGSASGAIAVFGGPVLWTIKTELWLIGVMAPVVIGVLDLYPHLANSWRSKRELAATAALSRGAPPAQTPSSPASFAAIPLPSGSPATAGQQAEAPGVGAEDLKAKLEALNQLYVDGLITETDLLIQRKALLDGFSS
ncbi:MAG: hypothetical protein GWP08_08165 [Nitrospiraceae bacterium]|nr:hypothetical protein [Nitrospiraceae bacterium]